MNFPDKAWEIFISHANTCGLISFKGSSPTFINSDVKRYAILELGPGDSIFSSIIANALGAKGTWLIDSGDFATRSTSAYCRRVKFLRSMGLHCEDIYMTDSFEEVLRKSKANYLIEGVHSLHKLQDSSIDYCFSNAVLQHIPKQDFHCLFQNFIGLSVHAVFVFIVSI
jgi:hypothetical protein